jgi:glycosyltransferase involved in cell wall biosynthesis
MNEELQKDRRMRFLVNTNAPWANSGYGIEARDLMRRFKGDGWNVGMIGFSGHEGAPIEFEGYPIYGRMNDTWGSDAMYFHGKHFGAHFLLAFHDIWVLNPQFLQNINNEGGKIIAYVPIDQEPLPPNVLANLRYCYKIITFSEWGQKVLQKNGFTSTLILEGTDTNIFKPMDKKECRKFFNIPEDAFVIGMVGANKENPPRKGWQQALEAFKKFHDNHPEALFWFECNQEAPGGFPIRQYAEYLGIKDQLRNMDTYMSVFHAGSDIMAKLYNSFDILSHASLTEGFGLCQIEAMACGTPIVVNDYSAMPEVVIPGVTGAICKTGFKLFTSGLGFYVFPDADDLHEQYEVLYRSNRLQMAKACRRHVLNKYDIDKIYKEKWSPLLEELQTEILGPVIDNKTETK